MEFSLSRGTFAVFHVNTESADILGTFRSQSFPGDHPRNMIDSTC
jgi:hypothetical protein